MTQSTHTVEKIGGTSMTRLAELIGTLFQRDDPTKIYNRMFVVSAFGGITDLLLEHKKSGEAGVYARFANDEDDHGWLDALSGVAKGMREAHGAVLGNPADLSDADDFVRDRGRRTQLPDRFAAPVFLRAFPSEPAHDADARIAVRSGRGAFGLCGHAGAAPGGHQCAVRRSVGLARRAGNDAG